MTTSSQQVLIIGAGIGGLTAAALLARAGYAVTVLEAQAYPGGCAGTYFHAGYRFDAGATVAGGFQPGGPHELVGRRLGIRWPVRRHDPAWIVHLPDRSISVGQDRANLLLQFPGTEAFWQEQARAADLTWQMAAQGLPWPPRSMAELAQLAAVGLRFFPQGLRLAPLVPATVSGWLRRHGLHRDAAFRRFLDAQLLISAQTTSEHTNALYGATALDLARQGVYHVAGGIGGLAETLADRLQELGGRILYRRRVDRIEVSGGRVRGLWLRQGKHSQREQFMPADFVVANLTPWSLDSLLGEHSPTGLRREVRQRRPTWGAFVLHLGLQADRLPQAMADHHQIITEMEGPLGETRSLFVSLSPEWDSRRAPAGRRAATITTHTAVQPWWDLLAQDPTAYEMRKQKYSAQMLAAVERVIPGFSGTVTLSLPGSPVTYNFYTGRHLGMVGGFPQVSLFRARGPHTGLPNLRLVGDSIFPGQSTAGVSLGALRVAADVQRSLPLQTGVHYSLGKHSP